MVEVNCPKCGDTVEVDERRRAGKGKFRLTCGECGNRFAIVVSKPELQLESDSTLVSTPPGLDKQAAPPEGPANITPSPESDQPRSRWTRRGDAEAPTTVYPETGSSADPVEPETDDGEDDSDRFDEFADAEVALPGDPDDESTPMDFEDLAEAELALPGDPDEEEPSAPPPEPEAGDAAPAEDAEEEESVVYQISVDGEPSVDAVAAEPEDDGADRAGGMSMEMSAPSPLAKAGAAEKEAAPAPEAAAEQPPAEPADEPEAGDEPGADEPATPAEFSQTPLPPSPVKLVVPSGTQSEVLVSNLDRIPGHELELLGMVTHHFCRRGGGDRVRARKRMRAFGARYRRGLTELGRQASELGADAVVGVEANMLTTGPPDEPIIWVLLQGTAAKRRPMR